MSCSRHFLSTRSSKISWRRLATGRITAQRMADRLAQHGEQDVLTRQPTNIQVPRTPPRLQVMGVGDL